MTVSINLATNVAARFFPEKVNLLQAFVDFVKCRFAHDKLTTSRKASTKDVANFKSTCDSAKGLLGSLSLDQPDLVAAGCTSDFVAAATRLLDSFAVVSDTLVNKQETQQLESLQSDVSSVVTLLKVLPSPVENEDTFMGLMKGSDKKVKVSAALLNVAEKKLATNLAKISAYYTDKKSDESLQKLMKEAEAALDKVRLQLRYFAAIACLRNPALADNQKSDEANKLRKNLAELVEMDKTMPTHMDDAYLAEIAEVAPDVKKRQQRGASGAGVAEKAPQPKRARR